NVHSSTQSSLVPPFACALVTRSTHSSKWCLAGAHSLEFRHSVVWKEKKTQLASLVIDGKVSSATRSRERLISGNGTRSRHPGGHPFHPPAVVSTRPRQTTSQPRSWIRLSCGPSHHPGREQPQCWKTKARERQLTLLELLLRINKLLL